MLRYFTSARAAPSLPGVLAGVATEQTTSDPKELGRVAIVPFLDISGERQENRDEYRVTALDEVEERFRR